ncbi:class I SAM-dependent methyltransferase [Caulobacter sp. KR2-114]|uniref:class I SAM-dependent methyltransferase n=1 Tax=Caulobacter sp. KR2-114 TaxID=3400912 RepID=UPI003BFED748
MSPPEAGGRLKARLIAEIAAEGPMRVSAYMARCLFDPLDGYYATRPALGEAGDFVTAPLVSQMFGELIGLWAAETWARLGSPARFVLAEMGPGDGTLMADLLRAGRAAPGFLAAAEVWLVEASGPLQALQSARLEGAGVHWAATLDELPGDAPLVLLSNELLDCLPTDQFVRGADGRWAERRVGLAPTGDDLAFGLAALPRDFAPPAAWADAPPGAVVEVSAAARALGEAVGRRLAAAGGAALFIDYGALDVSPGDTLQALRRHRKEPPLAGPGEADLTVHADFASLLAGARAAGAATPPGLAQGAFLLRLGIEARAAALAARHPHAAERLGRQLDRLVSDDQMGALFKAVAICSNALQAPGFDEPPMTATPP